MKPSRRARFQGALARHARLYRVTDLDAGKIMKIAVENGITFYDSSYIALASMLRAPISSGDRDIIAVAPRYNVRVIRLHELIGLMGEACQHSH